MANVLKTKPSLKMRTTPGLKATAKVATAKGVKAVKDIEVGDAVLTDSGFKKVAAKTKSTPQKAQPSEFMRSATGVAFNNLGYREDELIELHELNSVDVRKHRHHFTVVEDGGKYLGEIHAAQFGVRGFILRSAKDNVLRTADHFEHAVAFIAGHVSKFASV